MIWREQKNTRFMSLATLSAFVMARRGKHEAEHWRQAGGCASWPPVTGVSDRCPAVPPMVHLQG